MTTYIHTIDLDDSERIALEAILEDIVERQGWENTIEFQILDKLQNSAATLGSSSYFLD